MFSAKLTLALACFSAASTVRAAATYQFTPLVTFASPGVPDQSSQGYAFGINVNGEVVGQQLNSGTAGYTTNRTAFASLGAGSVNQSSAQGINSGGVAAGYGVFNGDGTGNQYAVYYSSLTTPAQAFKMGTGTLGGSMSVANAINGNSISYEAVGNSTYAVASPVARAFKWNNGNANLTPLDPSSTLTGLGGTGIGATSNAQGLNSTGYVVGQATNSINTTTAFLYSPITSKMYDLNTAATGSGTYNSDATGINSNNVIVGQSDTDSGYPQAFRYSNYALPTALSGSAADQPLGGNFTLLGSLDATNPASEASAINNLGLIVGDSSFSNGADQHAFLYTPGIGMQDLNSLANVPNGWELNTAYAINDAGSIAGYATYTDSSANSYVYPYELTLPITAVPEPFTLGGFAVLATACLGRKRRLRAC